MNKRVISQSIGFDKSKIKEFLKQLEPEAAFRVRQLVHYPYYFFEFTVERKYLFHPIDGSAGCTIDAISGVGALIDTVPELKDQEVAKETIIQPALNAEQAAVNAQEFLYKSISLKIKVLSMPDLTLEKAELFYRPYWIVQGTGREQFSLAVDAVCGKYHPF